MWNQLAPAHAEGLRISMAGIAGHIRNSEIPGAVECPGVADGAWEFAAAEDGCARRYPAGRGNRLEIRIRPRLVVKRLDFERQKIRVVEEAGESSIAGTIEGVVGGSKVAGVRRVASGNCAAQVHVKVARLNLRRCATRGCQHGCGANQKDGFGGPAGEWVRRPGGCPAVDLWPDFWNGVHKSRH